MTDPKSANDPSMDDILASIRKIISDDEARAQVNSQQAAAQSGGRPAVTPPMEPKLHGAGRDDVLLLTDLIEEPRSDTVPPPIPVGGEPGWSGSATSKQCPSCRKGVGATDQFCMHCGVQLVEWVLRCPQCGAYPDPSDRYCIFCGTTVRSDGGAVRV